MSEESVEYKCLDSGERTEFNNGAVRDRGGEKSRPDLISPFYEEAFGHHMRRGAEKYSDWNWAKGMPNSEYWASLRRHVCSAEKGMTDEDHLCAIAFNIMALIHNRECLKLGLLPKSLNDWPVDWETIGGVHENDWETISGVHASVSLSNRIEKQEQSLQTGGQMDCDTKESNKIRDWMDNSKRQASLKNI